MQPRTVSNWFLVTADPIEKGTLDLLPEHQPQDERRMDMGSMVPLFIGPGVDISQAVTDLLNKRHQESTAKQRRRADADME